MYKREENEYTVGKRLVKNPYISSLLINAGFQHRITNIKQNKICKQCVEPKCKICHQYHGITHIGFDMNEEMIEVIKRAEKKRRDEQDG